MWSGHLQKALAVFQDECTVHFHMRILYFHMRITLCSYVIGFVTCGSEFPPTVRQSVIWLYYVSSQILMCLSLEMTPLSTPSKYIIFFFFLNQYIWDSTMNSNQIYKTWSYSDITPARRPLFVFHWQHKLLLSIAAVALPSRETVLMCQNWSAADPSYHKSNNSCFLTAMRPTN